MYNIVCVRVILSPFRVHPLVNCRFNAIINSLLDPVLSCTVESVLFLETPGSIDYDSCILQHVTVQRGWSDVTGQYGGITVTYSTM